MKHKMTVVTDMHGNFLGAVRNGTIQDGNNTLQFHAVPHPGHKHHEVEVDEELMRSPFEKVRDMLLGRVSAG
jgi:hypothetical protein